MVPDGGSSLERGSQILFQRHHSSVKTIVLALSIATTLLLSITASVYETIVMRQHSPLSSLWAQHYQHPAAYLYSANICVLQLCWLRQMSPFRSANYTQTASFSAHLIINNTLHLAFVLLYVQSHFKTADVITHCAFANISILYLRCNVFSPYVQFASLSGPLAWAFISFYWTTPSFLPISNPSAITNPVILLSAMLPLWVTFCGCAFHSVNDKDYVNGILLSCLAVIIGLSPFVGYEDATRWLPCLVMAFVAYGNVTVLTVSVQDMPAAVEDEKSLCKLFAADGVDSYGTLKPRGNHRNGAGNPPYMV